MPAWVSATAVSSGKRGSAPASAARSERSKTLPTWGPLPWVIASLQRPEATTGTMCSTVARVRWNWAPTEGSSPARVMAFPPRARTRMGAPAPAAPSGHTSSCTCESYDLRGEPVQHSVEAPSTEEAPSRHIAVAERDQRPREAVGAPPTRAPLEFPRKLPGYEATPLLAADRLAAELGVGRLWVKDESSRLGLPSFKILGASWGVYRAVETRFGAFLPWAEIADLAAQLRPRLPLALAAATDGNHGRAVARMARLLGLEARIFVPHGTARARIEAIESEGAPVTVVEGTYEEAVDAAAALAGERCLLIQDTAVDGQDQTSRWVIDGYSTIFWEIEDRLAELGREPPDLVAVQIGVGALAASVVRHFRQPEPAPRPDIVGVEPDRAACVLASMEAGHIVTIPGPHDSVMAGLNCGEPSSVAWPEVSGGIDFFVAIEDGRALDAVRRMAAAGPGSGGTRAAGPAGLLEILVDDTQAASGSVE